MNKNRTKGKYFYLLISYLLSYSPRKVLEIGFCFYNDGLGTRKTNSLFPSGSTRVVEKVHSNI